MHGQPFVIGEPDLYVSWSHTQGYVAAVAAGMPVGVDVERDRRTGIEPSLYASVLTEAEARIVRAAVRPEMAFLRQWVRKECLVKLGRATLDDMGRLELEAAPLRPEPRPSWREWSPGLLGLDWADAGNDAVGAACADLSVSSGRPDHPAQVETC